MSQTQTAIITCVKNMSHFDSLQTLNKDYNDLNEDELNIWKSIAKSCGLKNEFTAFSMWKKLCTDYFLHLFNMHPNFAYTKQMAFMQKCLSQTWNPSEDDSEDDIDLLEQLLESDDSDVEGTRPPSEKVEKTSSSHSDWTGLQPTFDEQSETVLQDPSTSGASSLELIFLGYAKSLQKMSPHLQLMTKMKIAKIMNEVEVLHFKQCYLKEQN